jgi:NRAMP (natural resistance-associated macrophage protein)-like metal ion transporter
MNTMSAEVESPKRNLVRRFFSNLGPGLTAGAADDDPSGIATYSTAGAATGTQLLWLALLTWPLMAAVQMMCARIGMVTGEGLAGAFHRKLPKPLIVVASVALLVANTINIGADLAGMCDAAEMLTGSKSHWFMFVFGAAVAIATVRFRYHQLAQIFKWLALTLFAYVATAFLVKPDWSAVAQGTFVPSLPKGRDGWAMIVAVMGTTISPYLFYWQASQEVEEEKAAGRRMLARRRATRGEIGARGLDVGVGTFFSNVVMYFIILTTALTLHKNGITDIQTSRQAAEALRPLAGDFAALLFTLGVLSVGFLAIPTLAGSAAYALAETFDWQQGLDAKWKSARAFYLVVIVSIVVGLAIDFANINPVKTLFWTAVINGVLAPFLLTAVLLVAADHRIMRDQPSSLFALAAVGLTTIAMFGAAIAMFVWW